MVRTVVGVLRGGNSNEYARSLQTGAAMLQALPEDSYDTRDILIDKNGSWHMRGMPTAPLRALRQLDVAVNAMHGGMGEDGTIARLLEQAGIAFTGSRAVPSAFSLHKGRAREALRSAGIRMPNAVVFSIGNSFTAEEMAEAVFAQFGPPYILKPANLGSSWGITVVDSILDLPDALADMLEAFDVVIVEEFLRGMNATVGIIEHFRNEDLYALPPVEIELPSEYRFLTNNALAANHARYVCPGNCSSEHKTMLMDVARQAHRVLGLSGYSDIDFILTPRGPYMLEANTTPALGEGAVFPVMLDAVGSSVPEFLQHAIARARARL